MKRETLRQHRRRLARKRRARGRAKAEREERFRDDVLNPFLRDAAIAERRGAASILTASREARSLYRAAKRRKML